MAILFCKSCRRAVYAVLLLLALVVTLPAQACLADGLSLPSGLFQYAMPETGHRDTTLGLYLGAGALLLATDRQTGSWYDSDLGEKNRVVDKPFRLLSDLGSGESLGAITLGLATLGKGRDRDAGRLAIAALVNETAAITLLKFAVGKERPDQSDGAIRYHGPSTRYSSFPSGHTAASVAVAHVLARERPRQKWLWYGLAAAVGYARGGAGKHFTSDIYFGAGVGLVSAEGALRHRDSLLSWRF